VAYPTPDSTAGHPPSGRPTRLEPGGYVRGWRDRAPGRRGAIRAVAFDLLAIFDPRAIDTRVAHVLPGADRGFATRWKRRLFEYCWIRASAGQYAPFDQLVLDALDDTARASQVELGAAASLIEPDATGADLRGLLSWSRLA
jgi:hypothetical protein